MVVRPSSQNFKSDNLKQRKGRIHYSGGFKVGSLHTNSIGHLAHETDMYLSSNEFDSNKLTFWIPGSYIANQYLYNVLCKYVRVSQNQIIKIIYRIATKYKFLHRYLIANVDCSPRNRKLLNDTAAKIQLPESDLEVAKTFLCRSGWIEERKIVVFCIRDNLYQLTRDPQSKVQNYRNSELEDFLPAVEYLCEENFFVIRMGRVAKDRFPFVHPNFLDYSFEKYKSDFLDIAIFALADFVISTGTGLDQVGEMFRKPVLRVNYLPIGDVMTRSRNQRVLPKLFEDNVTNKRLDLDEIVQRELFLANSDDQYAKANVKIISNPASSILEEVRHFVSKSNYGIKCDVRLQTKFCQYMSQYLGFSEQDTPILSPLWEIKRIENFSKDYES